MSIARLQDGALPAAPVWITTTTPIDMSLLDNVLEVRAPKTLEATRQAADSAMKPKVNWRTRASSGILKGCRRAELSGHGVTDQTAHDRLAR